MKENEAIVSKAFGKQSVIFDDIYDSNPIVNDMRDLIRREVTGRLKQGDHILEVNAGTGTDALFFAGQGYSVTAVEISPQMVEKAQEKIQRNQLQDRITFTQGSYEKVPFPDNSFDYLYSNFGGLNCTENLPAVIQHLADKIKSGGSATLTILPPFTLWEKLFYLRGNTKLANRRKSGQPSEAHLEGEYFKCWYYTPADVTDALRGNIKDVSVTGICVVAPPSFLDFFPEKYPKWYRFLWSADQVVAKWPVFRSIGDYFMISFTKV